MKRNKTELYPKNVPTTTATKENDWKYRWMSLSIKNCVGFGMCASLPFFCSHSKQTLMRSMRRKIKTFGRKKQTDRQTGHCLFRECNRRKNKRRCYRKGKCSENYHYQKFKARANWKKEKQLHFSWKQKAVTECAHTRAHARQCQIPHNRNCN